MVNNTNLNEEFKHARSARVVLIEHLKELAEEHREIGKRLGKLKPLRLNNELAKLVHFNNELDACHLLLRKDNVLLKKLNTFAREKLKFDREELELDT